MLVSGDNRLPAALKKQAQLVAAADIALAKAERAVTQARTPHAAADAHRRADAALIDVEEAENEVHRLTRRIIDAVKPARSLGARAARRTDQTLLFDVG